jgi:hypothetical protein
LPTTSSSAPSSSQRVGATEGTVLRTDDGINEVGATGDCSLGVGSIGLGLPLAGEGIALGIALGVPSSRSGSGSELGTALGPSTETSGTVLGFAEGTKGSGALDSPLAGEGIALGGSSFTGSGSELGTALGSSNETSGTAEGPKGSGACCETLRGDRPFVTGDTGCATGIAPWTTAWPSCFTGIPEGRTPGTTTWASSPNVGKALGVAPGTTT